MTPENFESIVDYTTVLNNFEGPLDLLLYLINKNEIAIEDIFVSQVTEQFLDYMKGLPYIDVDKVTDYLNIAATIIKIKAQSLVPNLDEDPAIDEEIEEDKAQLIRALEEFKIIKEETAKLKDRETVGYCYKESDRDVGTTRTVFNLEDLTTEGLIEAFANLLSKREEDIVKESEVREIPRDEYTVEEKAQIILESLETLNEVAFEQLFPLHHSKPEIITTFQALLELLKHQVLLVRQECTFGTIYISRNPDTEDTTFGQFDEYH